MNQYPHEGGCEKCADLKLCNGCGTPIPSSAGRCTNGRCLECHQTYCGLGGSIGLGHGFWVKKTKFYKHDGETMEQDRIARSNKAMELVRKHQKATEEMPMDTREERQAYTAHVHAIRDEAIELGLTDLFYAGLRGELKL